jgi:hypothetical protein
MHILKIFSWLIHHFWENIFSKMIFLGCHHRQYALLLLMTINIPVILICREDLLLLKECIRTYSRNSYSWLKCIYHVWSELIETWLLEIGDILLILLTRHWDNLKTLNLICWMIYYHWTHLAYHIRWRILKSG